MYNQYQHTDSLNIYNVTSILMMSVTTITAMTLTLKSTLRTSTLEEIRKTLCFTHSFIMNFIIRHTYSWKINATKYNAINISTFSRKNYIKTHFSLDLLEPVGR